MYALRPACFACSIAMSIWAASCDGRLSYMLSPSLRLFWLCVPFQVGATYICRIGIKIRVGSVTRCPDWRLGEWQTQTNRKRAPEACTRQPKTSEACLSVLSETVILTVHCHTRANNAGPHVLWPRTSASPRISKMRRSGGDCVVGSGR